MTKYWVLQGNPTKWDSPESLYYEPIRGWSVTGAEKQVHEGDGVLIWISNSKPALRGLYAAGQVSGTPKYGYPLGWGSDKQRATRTPFVPLSIHWYLVHHPVSVEELTSSPFATNQILGMPRKTAYPCTAIEFKAAVKLMQAHGPTVLPVHPGVPFEVWWDTTA